MTALFIEGYIRRRAWAAFHAGYGIHAKDAKLEHLTGRAPAGHRPGGEMSLDEMAANVRRWRIATARKVKPEGDEPPAVGG